MGMAANQARLMTITARKSDLELRAQQISAAKMRCAQASATAAMEYSNALNRTGMQVVTTMVDKTVQTPIYGQMAGNDLKTWLTNKSYVLYNGTDESAALNTLSSTQIDSLVASDYKAANKTITNVGGTYNLDGVDKMQIANALSILFCNETVGWASSIDQTNPVGKNANGYYLNFTKDSAAYSYYNSSSTTIEAMQKSAYFTPATLRDDAQQHDGTYPASQVINTLIAQGVNVPKVGGVETPSYSFVTIPTVIVDYKEETIQVPVTTVNQGSDEALNQAQAKYDAYTADIAAQEKIFDMELTQVNTEHDAIKTEYDAIKSLIKDNTEKSFNVFG